jgi:hypothetical protein
MNSDIENTTRDLLKSSLLNLPDQDFSNRVMERIRPEASPEKPVFSSISIAWIFAIFSLALVPFGLSLFVKDFQTITIFSIINLTIDSTTLSIILSIFFASAILFLLDRLVKLTFSRKKYFI